MVEDDNAEKSNVDARLVASLTSCAGSNIFNFDVDTDVMVDAVESLLVVAMPWLTKDAGVKALHCVESPITASAVRESGEILIIFFFVQDCVRVNNVI